MNTLQLIASASEVVPTDWESGGMIALKVAAVALFVAANGFFVGSEFAMVKVRASQLDTLIEEGNRKAVLARHVIEQLDAYLSTVQFGITLSSLALGALAEPFAARLISPLLALLGFSSLKLISAVSLSVGFFAITWVTIIFGELGPKYLAIKSPLKLCLLVARPLRMFYLVFRPFIYVIQGSSSLILKRALRLEPRQEELAHSEEELRLILAESEKAEEVTPLGKEILINALDLRRRVVRDIMTPRGEVIFLDVEEPFEKNLEIAQMSRHTRFPLCRGHLDDTLGLVHIKDLMPLLRENTPDLTSVKRDIMAVPEMMALEKLLTSFLQKHAHIALVVDEYGGTVGIVTLDNVMEEIVGDIQDEFDADKQEYKRISDDEFVVNGTYGLYEFNELAGVDLESSDVSTIGGYVTHVLGHLPKQGEQTKVEGFLVTITQTDGRRIGQLHFKRISSGEGADSAEV
jgi:CBS domain containing-hemolysin-like protein